MTALITIKAYSVLSKKNIANNNNISPTGMKCVRDLRIFEQFLDGVIGTLELSDWRMTRALRHQVVSGLNDRENKLVFCAV